MSKYLIGALLLAFATHAYAVPYQFKRYQGTYPQHSVHVGDTILCQAHYKTGTHPGYVDSDACMVAYGNQLVAVKEFSILVSEAKLQWKSHLDIDYEWVKGGFENGKDLFFCRREGSDSVGKVVDSKCQFVSNGISMVEPLMSSEILVYSVDDE